MKIIKSLEESGLFIKGVGKLMKNETKKKQKQQKDGFLLINFENVPYFDSFLVEYTPKGI